MKYLYKYLIYLSLFFLIFFLAKHDLLEVPDIYFPSLLIVSLIFLFTGFIASSIAWQKALKQSDIKASIQEGIAGMGLSIFGKYIPGKIWILLGRAAYTSEKNNYPLSMTDIGFSRFFFDRWTETAWRHYFFSIVSPFPSYIQR